MTYMASLGIGGIFMQKILASLLALLMSVTLSAEGIRLDFSYKEVVYCTEIPTKDTQVSVYKATATDDSRLEVLATLVSQTEKEAILHLSWQMIKSDGSRHETVWNGIKVFLDKATPFMDEAESVSTPYLVLNAKALKAEH